MSFKDEPLRRARQYADRRGLTLGRELGFGVHGVVVVTENQPVQGQPARRQSAVKAHQRETEYLRERDVYLRLLEGDVTRIRGCEVPQFIDCDDALLVLEMTIVKPPYVLDFGGAYLDQPVEFSEEVMADWRAEKIEQFEERWPEVERILAVLQTYGIFMIDVHPNNIWLGQR
jgi:hypothetical protein